MELKLATPKGYSVAKDLRTTAASLKANAEAIEDFVGAKLDQISNEIVEKSEQLEALKIQLDEKRRVETLDLELLIKADKHKAFEALATDLGYAVISESGYNALEHELASTTKDVETRITTAVEKAKKAVYAEAGAKAARVTADHQVATAQLEADNSMLKQKVEFLDEQIKRLNTSLDTAQNANVRIAEASKAPVIHSGK